MAASFTARPSQALPSRASCTLSLTRQWDRFKGFSFGLADEEAGEPSVAPLTDLPLLGADGKATFPLAIDQLPSTTRLVKAKVAVRMRETGGRAVERIARSGMCALRATRSASVPNSRKCRRAAWRSSASSPSIHKAHAPALRARNGRWSGSSGTTSGTATADRGTTSR
ncbi:hypothetical protein QEZ48_07245 [Aquamicrobium lusatiense]|nr:hypothetical protein [Aquamicrobium lusatiense]MDH4990626.1 hypothetical protein [Aquamicrobium lusatiense]